MEDLIKKVKELGVELQNQECYKEYMKAKEDNDNDEALQKLIGEFNLLELNIGNELEKENKDEEKLKALNDDAGRMYREIMATDSMQKFQSAKAELDTLLTGIITMIQTIAAGGDPDDVNFEDGCTGNCSTCHGCH